MIIASVSDIKAKFSAYLKKTIAGQEVIVASHNVPIATLKSIAPKQHNYTRTLGSASGKVKISKNFNDSLKSFEKDFYGGNL